MSIVVLRGNNLEIELGLVFWSYNCSNRFQMTKYYAFSKRAALYILKPYYKSWNHYFVIFWRSFAKCGSGATSARLPHGFTPTSTCPSKNINGRCLGYVACECRANFQIEWESFARIGQQKKSLEPLNCGGNKCQVSVCGLIPRKRVGEHIPTELK